MKLLLVAVLAVGCGSSKSKPNKPLVAACEGTPGGQCSYLQCGGNSQIINSFPIQGIRSNGDCNAENMQMMPGSLTDGAVPGCKGMTLGVDEVTGVDPAHPDEKRLVLVGRSATATCTGQQLQDAKFEIRTKAGAEQITIEQVTTYLAPNKKTFPAYRLIWKDNNGAKSPLCTKGGQKLRTKLGAPNVAWGDTIPDPDHELVMPIVSELYTENGKAIDQPKPWWTDTSLEWIHLACVDDALAKRSIHGQLTSDRARSRAALRMWTADYCGGRPFTMRGKWIDWGDPSLPWEAQWTENGARCLTKPRIIYENGNEVVPSKPSKMLEDFCSASTKDCKQLATWIGEAKNCRKGYIEDDSRAGVLEDCPKCTSADNCQFDSHNVK